MGIPNMHTTIDYAKLIEIQANQSKNKNYIKKNKKVKQKHLPKR